MSRFLFSDTPLTGLLEVQRAAALDSRGFFSRFYCAEEFLAFGIDTPVVQINHTLTHKKGAVRGLHFQRPPRAEMKLVSCLRGEVWDVAVDLRADSPTFMKWHACVLSSANMKSLMIPEGFAHGFQALTDDCELLYLHTATFDHASEGALNVEDVSLGIVWPLPISELSERDRSHPMIDCDFKGITF